jgi:hypothetical protein
MASATTSGQGGGRYLLVEGALEVRNRYRGVRPGQEDLTQVSLASCVRLGRCRYEPSLAQDANSGTTPG